MSASPGVKPAQPRTEAEGGPPVLTHHDHLRRLDEKHAKIAAAPFGDPPEDRSPARAVLGRHQTDPRGKVPTLVESLPLANGRDHCRRDHRTDPGDGHDVGAVLFRAADLLDLARDVLDPFVQPKPVAIEPDQDGDAGAGRTWGLAL